MSMPPFVSYTIDSGFVVERNVYEVVRTIRIADIITILMIHVYTTSRYIMVRVLEYWSEEMGYAVPNPD